MIYPKTDNLYHVLFESVYLPHKVPAAYADGEYVHLSYAHQYKHYHPTLHLGSEHVYRLALSASQKSKADGIR